MKKLSILVAFLLATAAVAQSGGGDGPQPVAAGLIQFDPPQALECVAVRVDVPEDKMITGLTWFNGSSEQGHLRLLVASGSDYFPPAHSEAISVADSVIGAEQAWSSVTFTTPVASESGTLFVLVEYPPGYTPPAEGAALGVGYVAEESPYAHFTTGDGINWVRVASRCRVLVEPVLADRIGGVALKSRGADGDPPAAEGRVGLFVAPNPFNPKTNIDLYLTTATSGSVRILDVRGRLVIELHRGELVQGRNALTWAGCDGAGRRVASGVYWVLAETGDKRLVKKVLLIK